MKNIKRTKSIKLLGEVLNKTDGLNSLTEELIKINFKTIRKTKNKIKLLKKINNSSFIINNGFVYLQHNGVIAKCNIENYNDVTNLFSGLNNGIYDYNNNVIKNNKRKIDILNNFEKNSKQIDVKNLLNFNNSIVFEIRYYYEFQKFIMVNDSLCVYIDCDNLNLCEYDIMKTNNYRCNFIEYKGLNILSYEVNGVHISIFPINIGINMKHIRLFDIEVF